MRDATQDAAAGLGLGLLVASVRAGLAARSLDGSVGDALVLVLGCAFSTVVLWAILSMRALVAGAAWDDEVDDGLWSAAVAAWAMALLPPRAENFISPGGVDELTLVFLPACLLAVPVVLAVRAVRPGTARRLRLARALAALGLVALLVAGLRAVSAEAGPSTPLGVNGQGSSGVNGLTPQVERSRDPAARVDRLRALRTARRTAAPPGRAPG